MLTHKMVRSLAYQFDTKALQDIGIAAARFANMCVAANSEPWNVSADDRDTVHAFQMLCEACKQVIKCKEGLDWQDVA